MAITNVQSVNSATNTIALNGVTAGNTLVLMIGYYRDTGTDAVFPTPTDSSGNTVNVAVSPVPSNDSVNAHDLGVAIFYVTNASAGTHTFTMSSVSAQHATLTEFSPLTSSSFDVATSATTNGSSSATSQVTGTTASTAQANELVVICCTLGATAGSTSDVLWTDPVSGFTTLQKVVNLASDLPILHAWKEVSGVGAQSATFNWGVSNSTGFMQAGIATFKASASGADQHEPFVKVLIK
jgi:hypothetical protein